MKRLNALFWPLIGLTAVIWSVKLLFDKLRAEAAADALVRGRLAGASFLGELRIIADVIGAKLAVIPPHAYLLAALSTLVAYAALAWYDRIALLHLRKAAGISFMYVAVCSFVTYALSHNIGASVVSGGMVRLRAYTAKGLTASEVAVVIALCTFTFAFGTLLMLGVVLIVEPQIVRPLSAMSRRFAIGDTAVMATGAAFLVFCGLYVLGALLRLHPLRVGALKIVYPAPRIVARQFLAGPLELAGAAGIIYFALPEGAPNFIIVLGAFLMSFSAGLLSQVPGGVGVMEAVFLAIMPQLPAAAVVAALLVWRLLYLLVPLALAIPVIVLFERSQLAKAADGALAGPDAPPMMVTDDIAGCASSAAQQDHADRSTSASSRIHRR